MKDEPVPGQARGRGCGSPGLFSRQLAADFHCLDVRRNVHVLVFCRTLGFIAPRASCPSLLVWQLRTVATSVCVPPRVREEADRNPDGPTETKQQQDREKRHNFNTTSGEWRQTKSSKRMKITVWLVHRVEGTIFTDLSLELRDPKKRTLIVWHQCN